MNYYSNISSSSTKQSKPPTSTSNALLKSIQALKKSGKTKIISSAEKKKKSQQADSFPKVSDFRTQFPPEGHSTSSSSYMTNAAFQGKEGYTGESVPCFYESSSSSSQVQILTQ